MGVGSLSYPIGWGATVMCIDTWTPDAATPAPVRYTGGLQVATVRSREYDTTAIFTRAIGDVLFLCAHVMHVLHQKYDACHDQANHNDTGKDLINISMTSMNKKERQGR